MFLVLVFSFIFNECGAVKSEGSSRRVKKKPYCARPDRTVKPAVPAVKVKLDVKEESAKKSEDISLDDAYVLSVGSDKSADQILQQFFEEDSKDKRNFMELKWQKKSETEWGRPTHVHGCDYGTCNETFKKPSSIAQHIVTESHPTERLLSYLREWLNMKVNVKYN